MPDGLCPITARYIARFGADCSRCVRHDSAHLLPPTRFAHYQGVRETQNLSFRRIPSP